MRWPAGSLIQLLFPSTTVPSRRFFIGLAGFLIITIPILLLRHPLSSLPPSFSYPDVFGSGRSLSSWLLEEEAGYSAFVQKCHDALGRLGEGYNPWVLCSMLLIHTALPLSPVPPMRASAHAGTPRGCLHLHLSYPVGHKSYMPF